MPARSSSARASSWFSGWSSTSSTCVPARRRRSAMADGGDASCSAAGCGAGAGMWFGGVVCAGRSAACSPAATRPKRAVKWNVEPRPGALSTHRRPPIRSTSWRLIVRPRPVPPKRRVVELSACMKGWKMRDCCSASRPMPVSRTHTCSSTSRSSCATGSMPSVTSPWSVNLIALLPRLTITWRSRVGSPTSRSGKPGAALNSSARPFSSAFSPSTSAICATTASSVNSMRSSARWPASTLETSRMSSRICSRLRAAPCAFST
jgi:hypothetical protein